MFDTVRNNPKFVQGFLLLITLPFAFWGVESYVRNIGGGSDLATVGDSKISQQEFQQAMNEQQERMRQALGRNFNPAMFDTPEVRRSVLDSLVNQRLLALYATKARIGISDTQLVQFITSVPGLQDNGKFSPERYDALVAGQGMTKDGFEAKLRRDLVLQQAVGAVADTGLVAKVSSDRWLAVQLDSREIADTVLKPEQFAGSVKIGDDAIKTFYENNRKAFEQPEQLRAEYLVLSQDALLSQITVSDEDIKKAYQEHADRYQQPEERQASHILIRAAKDAPAAEVEAAQKKADQLLAEVRKAPADFAKVAKANSQDPGSAEKGGDLGWFGRGAMVKPFEDSVFSLKENEISGVVRSDFGFHIIRLTGVKPAKAKPLEQVRDEIAGELKRQAAAKKYAELAEGFTNMVYEQSDSLKPAAEKYKLQIQQSAWLPKGGQGGGQLANAKLQTALFSDDAIKNKRNTEAVEVAPNTLVSARVLEHKPASLVPLETVKADIEKRLIREESAKLAKQAGEEKLAKLAKGEDVGLTWGAARTVQRFGAQGLPPAATAGIFHADVSKLPSYSGAVMPDGSYALYKITKATPYAPTEKDEGPAGQLRQQYAGAVTERDLEAWLAALRQRFPVTINQAALASKDKQ